jgi:LPXTG-motif cell wall-anchored protein
VLPLPGTAPHGSPSADPAASGALPPLGRPESPWAEARRDWPWAALLVVVLAVAGVLVGLLWWGIAPRAQFTVTPSGPQVVGNPSDELLAADDSLYTLLVAGLGLLAGLGTWLVRRRRGPAALLGVAVGMLAADAVAWQVGELLGPGPGKAELARVGARVTTSLHLAALPALAVGPFAAVLVLLLATLWNRADDLGRPPAVPGPGASSPSSGSRTPAAAPGPPPGSSAG